MTARKDDYVPDMCDYWWTEGIGNRSKRHMCNRRDYPFHTHSCCCGALLTFELGAKLRGLKAAEV